jgi:hypothetical protein
MKKIFCFLFFVFLVGNLKGQNEVLLRTLGRAPLAAYLSSEDELRYILGKYNEEVGQALDYFPGGTLGEEVYISLYQSIDEIPIWKEQIPIGQKIYWMMYKNGGLLKNIRWAGNDPIEAFVFEIEVNGKIFKFAVPLRCGNISLVEIREISRIKPQKNLLQRRPQPPLRRENPQKIILFSQPKIYQPQVVIAEKVYSYHKRVYRTTRPQPRPQPRPVPQPVQPVPQPVQPVPQPTQPVLQPAQPVPQPALVENPKLKIKFGTGWNQMNASSLEHEEKTDFSSLIPKEDSLVYNEIAAWLYTPGGKGSSFVNGQKINLLSQINNFKSKQSGFPIFVGIEGNFIDNFYVGINFFHMGKFNIQYEEIEENIFVNEMRFLGNYEIDNVDVYYVGFDRQRNESMVNEKLSINEISGEVKYEISLLKDFSILPLMGVSWQIQRGQIEKNKKVTQLYPFREEVISTENIDIPSERIKENYFHPYLGVEIEFPYIFLRGKYCFGDFSKRYNSPWEIQGGISIKF